ncbi:MAG: RHS repeat-associated core domain-containing protein, partial [Nitrososphaera sp.]|nr:RHS repeat-associated core domain-containing protein [Nitrososphaera sp.]
HSTRVYGSHNAGTYKTGILSTSGAHTHTITGSTASTGIATPTTQSGSNLPPYTTVVFCKKIAPSQPGGGGNYTVRKYYFTDEDRVAMRENGTLYFLANDHLGSTSIVIDTNGVKISEMRYKPWGETRYELGNLPTDYQYTGQRNNEEIGLYYYGARWYDTTLGRFAQADTNIPAHQGAQGWDRYAYVNNNPIQFTDSSGQWIETAFDIFSLGMTINDIRNEGFTVMNTISLVTDVAAVILPVVPAGVSHMLRAGKYASKATNMVDTASDSAKLINKAGDWIKNITKKADDDLVTLYHGSIDNATSIFEDGLDIYKSGSTYVSDSLDAAKDAINYRLKNFPREVTDPGIIVSKVPKSVLEALDNGKDIIKRPYSGFHPYTLDTVEYVLRSPVAKNLFNKGITKLMRLK